MRIMKNNALIGVCLLLFFFILGATYIARDNIRDYLIGVHKTDTVFKEKTDTIWKDTTITKEKLVPKEVYITKVDTFYKKDGSDTIIKTENKVYKDTLCYQNDSIILESYISGVKPSLDSTKAFWLKSKIITTNTITVTKYVEKPRKRLHFAPNVSTGYGFINKNLDVYLGFGINYEL